MSNQLVCVNIHTAVHLLVATLESCYFAIKVLLLNREHLCKRLLYFLHGVIRKFNSENYWTTCTVVPLQ